jgi:hypothetical protein
VRTAAVVMVLAPSSEDRPQFRSASPPNIASSTISSRARRTRARSASPARPPDIASRSSRNARRSGVPRRLCGARLSASVARRWGGVRSVRRPASHTTSVRRHSLTRHRESLASTKLNLRICSRFVTRHTTRDGFVCAVGATTRPVGSKRRYLERVGELVVQRGVLVVREPRRRRARWRQHVRRRRLGRQRGGRRP